MALESTSGTTSPCMRESGSRTKFTALDSMFGLMEDNMKGSGRIITCMVVESTLGRTAESTRESTWTTESTVMVSILGQTEDSMQAAGKEESSTEKVCTDWRTEQRKTGSGKKERGRSGSKSENN